jgi:trans-aconitate 2-methyltransferase
MLSGRADRVARSPSNSTRTAVLDDLLAMAGDVPPRPSILDLGCGDGRVTREVHRRLGARATVGVDRDPRTLEAARSLAAEGVEFVLADHAALEDRDERWDVIFSSATLQSIPDHPATLALLARLLCPAGQLLLHIPDNFDAVAIRVAESVACEPPFELDAATRGAEVVLRPEEYAVVLHQLGFRHQRVELRIYAECFPTRAEFIRAVEGAALSPYTRLLERDVAGALAGRYRERMEAELDDFQPYLHPLRRLLVAARL